MDVFAHSIPGSTIGGSDHPNQDDYCITPCALAVFDGLGGHPGSEHASRVAAEAAMEFWVDDAPVSAIADLSLEAAES